MNVDRLTETLDLLDDAITMWPSKRLIEERDAILFLLDQAEEPVLQAFVPEPRHLVLAEEARAV